MSGLCPLFGEESIIEIAVAVSQKGSYISVFGRGAACQQ